MSPCVTQLAIYILRKFAALHYVGQSITLIIPLPALDEASLWGASARRPQVALITGPEPLPTSNAGNLQCRRRSAQAQTITFRLMPIV